MASNNQGLCRKTEKLYYDIGQRGSTLQVALGTSKLIKQSKPIARRKAIEFYIVSNNGGSGGEGISISHKFDCPAIIVEGRTLIPLRALGELLGLDVSWDGNKYLVTISA